MGCSTSKVVKDVKIPVTSAFIKDADSESDNVTTDKEANALTIRAILVIQRWYRRYLERMEARRRQAWSIYESLEYANENDQTRLYNFFNDILAGVAGGQDQELLTSLGIVTQVVPQLSHVEEEEELRRTTNPDDVKIDPRYRGIHIKMPMTPVQLESLIHTFEHKKKLHTKYVLVILHQVRNHLKTMPNITYVSTLTAKRITVIGDLHGKLDDLFIILFKNGMPSENNPYVFNGDFVDRGNQSLEVIMTLFATFLLNPNAIFFNRGNHEDYVMNLRYGFAKEIMIKYPNDASRIVRLFQDVFSWLPLLTIIDKKILITHGGISDKTDLELIDSIPRHKYLSVLRPPIEEDADGFEMIDAEAWRQLLDLLWSDPKAQFGCTPNTFRGGGVNWGPDITDLFMHKYNLNLLIRSHECKPDGFEYTHNNKVLTLFSASNYYEIGSNRGAYAQLLPMPKELKPHIVQYIFTEQTSNMKITIKQRTNTMEQSATVALRNTMLANKSDLIKEFEIYDTQKAGFVKPIQWCKVMGDILVMNIPWRSIANKLARINKNGMIDYMSMFENTQIVFGNMDDLAGGASFNELIYRNKGNLETIFRAIDKDNSGHISEEEFAEACSVLCHHTGKVLTNNQIKDMARAMDQNKDGEIDFNEFLEAFRIVDQQHKLEVKRSSSMVKRPRPGGTTDGKRK